MPRTLLLLLFDPSNLCIPWLHRSRAHSAIARSRNQVPSAEPVGCARPTIGYHLSVSERSDQTSAVRVFDRQDCKQGVCLRRILRSVPSSFIHSFSLPSLRPLFYNYLTIISPIRCELGSTLLLSPPHSPTVPLSPLCSRVA